MNITKDKLVSLAYELRIDGTDELVEKLDAENPLKFISGAGFLLPEFEQKVEGMTIGDKFNFVLKSDNAYGPVDEKAIIDIDRSIFSSGDYDEDFFEVGKTIPMMTKSGQRVDGKIISATAESIKMDFNHPMAGKDLNFSGYVVDVKNSTDEDYQELYGHGDDCSSGGCESCGGSCG
jgi:FKBP-type peptidyl-prolyl cis-trans isomerase SlyD